MNENLVAQSTSLTKIGNIYSDEYKKEAFDFFMEADVIASETKDAKQKVMFQAISRTHLINSTSHKMLLKYYSSACKEYSDAKDRKKLR